MAPDNFGRFSNMLLVGNFGDGRINVFDPQTFEPKGHLKNTQGKAVVIRRFVGILHSVTTDRPVSATCCTLPPGPITNLAACLARIDAQ